MPEHTRKPVSITQIVTALTDNSRPFPPTFLYRFSDLERNELSEIRRTWPLVNPERRFGLLEDLEEMAESDTTLDFDELAKFAISDDDARVRTVAIRLLWQNEDPKLIPVLISVLETDPEPVVRAAAATALGIFIYLGEVEDIPETYHKKVEETLLDLMTSPELPLVRRRALESLGFSSREEVPPLISTAYETNDKEWMASALFAMGRSADQAWGNLILKKLNDPEVDVQLEAIRAAGELSLQPARQPLLDLLEDAGDLDDDIRAAAVWSLSQIGGDEVQTTLEKLMEETEDEDEAEYIESALENLQISDSIANLTMLDFPLKGDDDLDEAIDLSDDDEETGE